MRICTCLSMLLFTIGLLSSQSLPAQGPPEEVEKAQPKEGRTVDPPLSKSLPEGYDQLPSFGSIDWEVSKLPWVAEGPYAGISGLAMAVHKNRIIVSGGFIPGGDGTETKKTNRTSHWAWSYDPVIDSWFPLPNMPGRREYTRGIAHEDFFYVLGGGAIKQTEEPPYRPYNDVFRIDLSKKKPAWEDFASLNVARTHMAVGAVGNKLLAIGGNEYVWEEKGYSANTIRDTTEVYDLDDPDKGWQQKAAIPTGARGWTASVPTEDAFYLFGGVTWKTAGGTDRFKEAWCYRPDEDIWEEKKPAPVAISGWEAALYQNRYAIMAGGVMQRENEKGEAAMVWSDLCWAYDIQEDKWFRVEGVLPPGAVFNDPGVAIMGDTIYVVGAEGPYGSHYNYILTGKIRPAK